jgi:hypothetical protein
MAAVIDPPTMNLTLEESARLLVQACALGYEFGFSPEALSTIHEIVRVGIGRMEHKGVAKDPKKILEAQINLARFVAEVIAHAKSDHLAEVQRYSVSAVQTSFCPVFPFA